VNKESPVKRTNGGHRDAGDKPWPGAYPASFSDVTLMTRNRGGLNTPIAGHDTWAPATERGRIGPSTPAGMGEGRSIMALYRLFFFDPDRHIKSIRDIYAPSEIDALDVARYHSGANHTELWYEARRVQTFNEPKRADWRRGEERGVKP